MWPLPAIRVIAGVVESRKRWRFRNQVSVTRAACIGEFQSKNGIMLCSRILLLGVALDTGNLGVSALADSSIKCIRHTWPGARIDLVGTRQRTVFSLQRAQGVLSLESWPVRFCLNPFVRDHYLYLQGMVFICRLLPFVRRWIEPDSTLGVLLRTDLVCDITGGDSFSDIYGIKRFVLGYLTKRLCQSMGKPFVMLPQTYGPFERPVVRLMAQSILRRSSKLFSRDLQSLEEIRNTAGDNVAVEVVPDVAFVLDSLRPDTEQTARIEQLKSGGEELIGLNISGLLYNGGYTGRNEFGLQCAYKLLVRNILQHFTKDRGCFLLLVPHVIPKDFAVENDLAVCQELWGSLPTAEQKKTIVLDGGYDQNQIKYLIGLCDFFIGARMHSTIAALSQCVPAVGMAYSKKFAGVFQTAGVEEYVVDMRQMDESQILGRINELYETRESVRRHLTEAMPKVQKKVMSLFDAVQCLPQSTQRARSSKAVTKEEATNFH